MAFGKYLADHPNQEPLDIELQRSLTIYRIALHNVLDARQPKESKKRANKKHHAQ